MRLVARLVGGALARRRVVLFLAAALVLAGGWAVTRSNVDVFPEFAPPFVEIQTEAPGLSAIEVETLVSAPIERSLGGIAGVEAQRSRSVPGLSSVILLFEAGTDLGRARQLVQERLPVAARQMPAIAETPAMLPSVSALSRVRMFGVTSDELSLDELSLLARWVVRPRLLAVPGVGNVSIWGERPRKLQILVDPARLASHGVSLDDVTRAAADASSRVGGGEIETANQRFTVTRSGGDDPARAMAAAPLHTPGLRLGDVAQVGFGSPLPPGAAAIGGRAGLLFVVEKQPDANTLVVTEALEAVLDELAPALARVHLERNVFRPATFVEQAIANLERAMALGVLMVVLVLVAFLADPRAALISAVALPLSLVAAVLVLTALGATLNVMILAGLVIAIGEVVDDAIVDVENISRRLRENRLRDAPAPVVEIVVEASLEVRSAIVYASLIVALVFVPLLLLGGVAGAFFRPLAQAYILAVLASLLIALTLTPVLAYLLLGQRAKAEHEGRLARVLHARYRPILARVVGRPLAAAGLLALLLAGSAVVAAGMGESFLPEFKENNFLMHWIGAPGTALPAMEATTQRVQREILAVPGVRGVGAHIGRAALADEIVGTNLGEHWIALDPRVDHDEAVAALEGVAAAYPGVEHNVMTYLNERIEEVLTGTSAPIVVRLFGPDLPVLRERAQAVAARLGDVPGVSGVEVEPQVLMPELSVELLPEAAAALGVGAGVVDRALATLVRGQRVGQIVEGDRHFDVVVRAEPGLRASPDALSRLLVETPAGPLVPLAQLARVRITGTPNAVARDEGARRIDVYVFTAPGADMGAAAAEVTRRARSLGVPSGTSLRVLGEYQARQDALRGLLGWGALALLGIILVVRADFGSWRVTALVVGTLPFALVGGVLAARLSDDVLSLGALVGLVTVLGIAARNGIMLISHFRHLEREAGVSTPSVELVVRGAEERLLPILMTALATAFGLLPLVVAGVKPGHEIEHPLAVVVLGGLATSTALNLLVMPALYLWVMGGRAR